MEGAKLDLIIKNETAICNINDNEITLPAENVKKFTKYNIPFKISLMDNETQNSARYIEDGKYDHIFINNKYYDSLEKVYDRNL